MGGEPLKQVKSIKFLGVIINKKLTWDDHKNMCIAKSAKMLALSINVET